MTDNLAYFIEARTGCSCCSGDNEMFGPFLTEEIATGFANNLYETSYLASQYARNGIYEISSASFEQLPDGRVIVDNRVFVGFEDTLFNSIGNPSYIDFERKHIRTIR